MAFIVRRRPIRKRRRYLPLSSGAAPATAVYVTRTPLVGAPVEYEAADDDLARGDALSEALSDYTTGDVITCADNETFETFDSFILPAGVTLEGGTGTTIVGTGLTQPLLRVATTDITIRNLTLTSDSAGIGEYAILTPKTITGVLIENVTITISDNTGDGIVWFGSYDMAVIQGEINNCTITSGTGLGDVGIYTIAADGSLLVITNCTVVGSADAILAGGTLGAVVRVNGGSYTGQVDGITSGGTSLYVRGTTTALGVTQADLNNDGGFLCVGPDVNYDTGKTMGVISDCGGGSPSGALPGGVWSAISSALVGALSSSEEED